MDHLLKGKIAYQLWKYRLADGGIQLDRLICELNDIAKASKVIPHDELYEFCKELVGEIVADAFIKPTE